MDQNSILLLSNPLQVTSQKKGKKNGLWVKKWLTPPEKAWRTGLENGIVSDV